MKTKLINPDPLDAQRRQLEQEAFCRAWLQMEGFDVKTLFKQSILKD
jgi:hypothetical protein